VDQNAYIDIIRVKRGDVKIVPEECKVLCQYPKKVGHVVGGEGGGMKGGSGEGFKKAKKNSPIIKLGDSPDK